MPRLSNSRSKPPASDSNESKVAFGLLPTIEYTENIGPLGDAIRRQLWSLAWAVAGHVGLFYNEVPKMKLWDLPELDVELRKVAVLVGWSQCESREFAVSQDKSACLRLTDIACGKCSALIHHVRSGF